MKKPEMKEFDIKGVDEMSPEGQQQISMSGYNQGLKEMDTYWRQRVERAKIAGKVMDTLVEFSKYVDLNDHRRWEDIGDVVADVVKKLLLGRSSESTDDVG